DEDSDEKRPTVQVGDPFTEKLLIEACLELMAEDAIIAIQDMGAAGLTSSSVEMADKGGVGFDLDLNQVPCREEGMTAYEMMLSESQERMLMVLKPGAEDKARVIFEKWELDFAVVGITTNTGRLVVTHEGRIEADMPVGALADSAPEYKRPWTLPDPPASISAEDIPAPNNLGETLETLMGSPHLCSRRWVWEQYDHMVMGDTVRRPGSDAAVVRIHGTTNGIAATCDVTPRYCAADPKEGGKQAVAEAWRNLTATGADPLAITDCMNFGNPERPDIMGQFAGRIEGMREACSALDFPVVSGNVSLYNETNGVAIPPTPAIGGVGLIPDIAHMSDIALKCEGETLLLLGEEHGHLGQSLYMDVILNKREGASPQVDLKAERATGDFVRQLIRQDQVSAVHDLSDGGLLVALAEMALAGGIGVRLAPYEGDLPVHAVLFGEDQARYLVATARPDAIAERAKQAKIRCREIGIVRGETIGLPDEDPIPLAGLRVLHEDWLPRYMTTQ
ncbi:MAG: phosphoribosylformylglycinamidine synthase subunit PurL, partial [Methyloligellaceae bacterium]